QGLNQGSRMRFLLNYKPSAQFFDRFRRRNDAFAHKNSAICRSSVKNAFVRPMSFNSTPLYIIMSGRRPEEMIENTSQIEFWRMTPIFRPAETVGAFPRLFQDREERPASTARGSVSRRAPSRTRGPWRRSAASCRPRAAARGEPTAPPRPAAAECPYAGRRERHPARRVQRTTSQTRERKS